MLRCSTKLYELSSIVCIMKKAYVVFFSLMMVTLSLSGCLGGGDNDTSGLEQQITDLENSKEDINQNLSHQNSENAELQTQLEELRLAFEQSQMDLELESRLQDENLAEIEQMESEILTLYALISAADANVFMYQSSLADAEAYRDLLLDLLQDTNITVDELHSMLEDTNETLLNLQSSIEFQQSLVVEWQRIADENRARLNGVNLSGSFLVDAELVGSDLSGANLT